MNGLRHLLIAAISGITMVALVSCGDDDPTAPPTPLEAPTSPRSFRASSSSLTKITLTWKDASGDEEGFEIEESVVNDGHFNPGATVPANGESLTLSDRAPETLYHYRIRTFNDAGYSPYAGPVSIETRSAGAPQTPVDLKTDYVGRSGIEFSWRDARRLAEGFLVERRDEPGGDWEVLGGISDGEASCIVDGLQPDHTYSFRVRAYNGSGLSDYAAEIMVTIPAWHSPLEIEDFNSIGHAVCRSADGGYVVTGEILGDDELFVAATDAEGTQQWARVYEGHGKGRGYDILPVPGGGYLVVGTSDAGSQIYSRVEMWTLLIGESGERLWESFTPGEGAAACLAHDEGFLVCGNDSISTERGIRVEKISPTGDIVWSRSFGDPEKYETAYDIAKVPSGGYIVAAVKASWFGRSWGDLWLLRLDESGEPLWSRTVAGPGDDQGTSIVVDSDGGFVLAGHTGGNAGELLILKTDAAGGELWRRTYRRASFNMANDIRRIPDGGFLVAGFQYDFDGRGTDFWVIRTDPDGQALWHRVYGGGNWDSGNGLLLQDDERYVVVGETSSYPPSGRNAWLVAGDF
ncbi:MAG: fibronectin type III domain-containing protein [bacterium]|nr:fibronectin type III domain-containing protein [bacterium]